MASRAIETSVIEVATSYVVANGYAPDDRTAVGLVLAGMALASILSDGARQTFLADYLATFPEAAPPMQGWAQRVERAV